jgi:hypothetical protein
LETREYIDLKLYNDQLNTQVFKLILFIYLLLPYNFPAFI